MGKVSFDCGELVKLPPLSPPHKPTSVVCLMINNFVLEIVFE